MLISRLASPPTRLDLHKRTPLARLGALAANPRIGEPIETRSEVGLAACHRGGRESQIEVALAGRTRGGVGVHDMSEQLAVALGQPLDETPFCGDLEPVEVIYLQLPLRAWATKSGSQLASQNERCQWQGAPKRASREIAEARPRAAGRCSCVDRSDPLGFSGSMHLV